MVQRSVVTFLAAAGAVLIIFGGILGFLLSFGPGGFGGRPGAASAAPLYGIVAVVLGLIILVFSGYTHYQGVERTLTGGVILIVMGAVSWAIVGGWLLVSLGSLLTILAGLLLGIEAVVARPSGRTHT